MSNKVYVFTAPTGRFNVDSAAQYGEIEYVTLPKGANYFNTDTVMDLLGERLAEYDPDADFLAVTGQSMLVALGTGLVLADFGRVRLLLFDARTGRYVERTVHHPGFSEGKNQ